MARALQELEALRNEDWHPDFIWGCLREFDNLNWDTYTCVERITQAKYSKEWGTVTKFEHFMNPEDSVINNELILIKAQCLLEKGGWYEAKTFKQLEQEIRNG